MAELVEQMRSSTQGFGISQKDSSKIPQRFLESQDMLNNHEIHSTPASNFKLSESMGMAHHDGSPSLASMSTSKSYSFGLSSSANVHSAHSPQPAAQKPLPTHLSLINDIEPNNTQFFEVLYVGKIKVSHKR
jgi:TBC1 domain family member 4